MNETVVYHITACEDWEAAQQAGEYRAPSLETEGFIHFSTRSQVLDTANRYYSGVHGLVLLEIEVARLKSRLQCDTNPHGVFPHLYGPLNLDAVLRVLLFEPATDSNRFEWPE